MHDDFGKNGCIERRSEPRKMIDKYFRVELSKDGLTHFYNFKLRDISSKGMCILVKEGSDVLKSLKVGDILDMKYYTEEHSSQPQQFKTKIKYITKDHQERFKGHCLVGLSIIE
ncbi:MAG: PilZ domain-containing protein [Desulfobacterales bacterium]|uniref:PilZ domain-containing protein n=1 Tax=Candidatus Desulfaltia bathyphila TaxID=2841697 RepID=A0A8J6TAY0_9BACT|nr:PilZ domain-containing protein [Candidatus Desulfaltia bathyphila]MBL7196164.1 PilZ domain-containing protein [Desulfobacterales bacterium]MBL7208099.1 PilZ domain-containing protein [Desulfobacterales bacterium]